MYSALKSSWILSSWLIGESLEIRGRRGSGSRPAWRGASKDLHHEFCAGDLAEANSVVHALSPLGIGWRKRVEKRIIVEGLCRFSHERQQLLLNNEILL